MRRFALLLLTACLAGCGGFADSGPTAHRGGRYAGIGIYSPGDLWQRLAAAQRPADRAAADLRDDSAVIVVVDSQTGEIRQCGNLTGYCIRMNPWSGALGREQSAPVNLTQHQADVDRERENVQATLTIQPEANAVTPAHRRGPVPARTPPRTSPR